MDKAFVDLNLVLYGTFSASILTFQLFLNFIQKVWSVLAMDII
jgi:hypothetical protein